LAGTQLGTRRRTVVDCMRAPIDWHVHRGVEVAFRGHIPDFSSRFWRFCLLWYVFQIVGRKTQVVWRFVSLPGAYISYERAFFADLIANARSVVYLYSTKWFLLLRACLTPPIPSHILLWLSSRRARVLQTPWRVPTTACITVLSARHKTVPDRRD
jgi:hypothetical protein